MIGSGPRSPARDHQQRIESRRARPPDARYRHPLLGPPPETPISADLFVATFSAILMNPLSSLRFSSPPLLDLDSNPKFPEVSTSQPTCLSRTSPPALGAENTDNYPEIKGSWYKGWIFKTRDALTSDELKERLKKVERAFELGTLEKNQAEVTKTLCELTKINL